MVGTAGFEPATPDSRSQCSARLSYVPTKKFALKNIYYLKYFKARERRESFFMVSGVK